MMVPLACFAVLLVLGGVYGLYRAKVERTRGSG
jgi:DNA-directed RNA polymerase subunit N (RpoN/RPB10)